VIANWHDVPFERIEKGHLCGTWADLGEAAGTVTVGVNRIQIEPNRWSTPFHAEHDSEEIFYVLGGSGISLQRTGAYDVRARDCIVHPVGEPHTLRAGENGLDVLAFGERMHARFTHFPRTNVVGNWPPVVIDTSSGMRPWDREVAAGEPDVPEISPRPATIVNEQDVEPAYAGDAGRWTLMARAAGATRTGLNFGHLTAGNEGAPPHCHSEDEEIFVILDGSGTLELWPSPARANAAPREDRAVRAGDVISRQAGSGIAHLLRAGDEGMSFLAYGTRHPNDICYYPRSNKIFWRGVGLIARLEPLDYDDGEPA
jgi:uncharacterized cupin superfamily protein